MTDWSYNSCVQYLKMCTSMFKKRYICLSVCCHVVHSSVILCQTKVVWTGFVFFFWQRVKIPIWINMYKCGQGFNLEGSYVLWLQGGEGGGPLGVHGDSERRLHPEWIHSWGHGRADHYVPEWTDRAISVRCDPKGCGQARSERRGRTDGSLSSFKVTHLLIVWFHSFCRWPHIPQLQKRRTHHHH